MKENSDEVRNWKITKPLRFTALLTLDHSQRPTGGEITSVRALKDDPGFADREANGDQTAKVLGVSIPIGPIYFTRDYVKRGLRSKKIYPQGGRAVALRTHKLLGRETHVDIRLPDGEFLLKVPIDYFRTLEDSDRPS